MPLKLKPSGLDCSRHSELCEPVKSESGPSERGVSGPFPANIRAATDLLNDHSTTDSESLVPAEGMAFRVRILEWLREVERPCTRSVAIGVVVLAEVVHDGGVMLRNVGRDRSLRDVIDVDLLIWILFEVEDEHSIEVARSCCPPTTGTGGMQPMRSSALLLVQQRSKCCYCTYAPIASH